MKAIYLLHSSIIFMVKAIWLNKIIFYTAVFLGCVIAFSPAEAGLQPQLNDKFLHTTGFFIMAFLANLAHPFSKNVYPVIGLVLLGMAIEVVQAYLPYREFSLWDWCADIFGVLLYYVFLAKPLTRYLFSR